MPEAALAAARAAGGVRSAYLHVPFCFHKCHYCDFYSFVDSRDQQPAFVARLIDELAFAAGRLVGNPPLTRGFDTIFIGGGTPTLLRPDLWTDLLAAIHRWLPPQPDCEFTVEANPETVTDQLAAQLVAGGVNRFSVGAQSFHPQHLKTLERWHEPASVARAMDHFRAAGVRNLNLDLIFAIPGQSLSDWMQDLDAALAHGPTHLSCYSLMYEPNTALTKRMQAGDVQPADNDLEAAMYEATIDRLADAGFTHYEISNWALPGHECQHNLRYWTNADWWAFGPSASGHVQGVRWKNVPRLGDYLAISSAPPITDVEELDVDGRIGEQLMLGLRLLQGIHADDMQRFLSVGNRAHERQTAIARHVDARLLHWQSDRLALTRKGLLLADSVLAELI